MSPNSVLKRRAALGAAIILLAQLMLILDTTIVNVALPRIDAGLGFRTATLPLVVNGYGLAFGALMLVGGRLGDLLVAAASSNSGSPSSRCPRCSAA